MLTLRDELPALLATTSARGHVARQARLVEELLVEAMDDGALHPRSGSARRSAADPLPRALPPEGCACHAGQRTAARVHPGAAVTVLDAGCCGMAGSFGFEREHYDLSMQIGALRLFPAVNAADVNARIAATGVSCRQQISHGTGRTAEHPVVMLRRSIGGAR